MPRYHLVEGKQIQFTAEEEALKDAEEKSWNDSEAERFMTMLREKRNLLLAETDWWASSDLTMTDEQKKYRQDLRDITSQTPDDNELSNINFPTKPE